MSSGAQRYKAALAEWLKTAVEEGWIDSSEIAALESLESHGAERLFETPDRRPLTVGLFGGTGVGKSSLLNRLVGEPVAEVGVQRPTSTGVTLYAHEQYPLRDLGDYFPVDRVRILTHRRDDYRDVLWIDMPDIDSVERANRELVFEWLPYIDWLIYVVSPERYRDDAGWRVLQQRGHRHHWLFVMNKWDTGSEEQYADFARILAESGFEASRLVRTSCTGGDDGLETMTGMIRRAVAEQGLARLQEVGERARLADLKERCEHYASVLGDDGQWRALLERAEAALKDKLDALERYLSDETAIAAAEVARRSSGDDGPDTAPAPLPRLTAEYIQDIESAIAVVGEGLPGEPVRRRTRTVLASLDERLGAAVADGFREGTARPGNALQRGLVTLMKRLVFALPLLVCVGIAWVVVSRYRDGLAGAGEFLGLDFLAHSLMVLGLAALVPWLAARVLRPSVRRSITKRVNAALRQARADIVDEWRTAMTEVSQRRKALRRSLDAIRAEIDGGS